MRARGPEETYLDEVFGLSDPDLAPVRAELARHNLEFMSISPHEARILQFLVRGFGITSIVEIGTLFGFSALCMAKALGPGGRLITLEKNPENWRIAGRLLGGHANVKSLCGEALSLLREIEGEGPFDMVFIDADKAGYLHYLDWAERNLRRGGLIVGDNSFLWGGVYGQPREAGSERQIQVMKEFNRRLADASRFNSILVPTSEGLTVAQLLCP